MSNTQETSFCTAWQGTCGVPAPPDNYSVRNAEKNVYLSAFEGVMGLVKPRGYCHCIPIKQMHRLKDTFYQGSTSLALAWDLLLLNWQTDWPNSWLIYRQTGRLTVSWPVKWLSYWSTYCRMTNRPTDLIHTELLEFTSLIPGDTRSSLIKASFDTLILSLLMIILYKN